MRMRLHEPAAKNRFLKSPTLFEDKLTNLCDIPSA